MSRYPVNLQDRGDIVCISWRLNLAVSGRVEIGKMAAEVEVAINTFLEARPHDARPRRVEP